MVDASVFCLTRESLWHGEQIAVAIRRLKVAMECNRHGPDSPTLRTCLVGEAPAVHLVQCRRHFRSLCWLHVQTAPRSFLHAGVLIRFKDRTLPHTMHGFSTATQGQTSCREADTNRIYVNRWIENDRKMSK